MKLIPILLMLIFNTISFSQIGRKIELNNVKLFNFIVQNNLFGIDSINKINDIAYPFIIEKNKYISIYSLEKSSSNFYSYLIIKEPNKDFKILGIDTVKYLDDLTDIYFLTNIRRDSKDQCYRVIVNNIALDRLKYKKK